MRSHKVWEEIDELAFHEKAIFLESHSRSQVEEPHDILQTNQLDFPLAGDFLDDFALVAAGPGEAPNVAAACLELGQAGEEIVTIRVAKNENFNLQACQRLSQIVELMNQVRQQELSSSEGQELCFDLVAIGCRPRILKQISGPGGLWNLVHEFCVPSRYPDTDPTFAFHVRGARTGNCKDDGSDKDEGSKRQASHYWTEMRQLVDRLHIAPVLTDIKRLALVAYNVRRSSAFRNLVSTQCQKPHRYLQIVERVGKIAKFFRSAVSIIRMATSAAVRNKRIKLETVPSVSRKIQVLQGHTVENAGTRLSGCSKIASPQMAEMQRFLRRWPKYVVHAEMLLLTFYEEHPQLALATNYIGISKRSCYLCANFIRLHNVFAVEGHHRQLYCLWTLPEEIRFESQDRAARFVRALASLQLLLAERVNEVSRPLHRPLPYLKESVANFSRATILARAHSLEDLGMVMEGEKGSILSLSRTPPLSTEDLPHIQIEQQEKNDLGTTQESIEEQSKTDVSILSLTAMGFTDIHSQLAVSPQPENPFTKGLSEQLPQAEKQPRRHRRRNARHKKRHDRRRKSTGSPTTPRRYRQAERKRAHVRTRKMRNPILPPGLVPTRRRLKKASLEGQRYETAGCLSILILACLRSARRVVLKIFQQE